MLRTQTILALNLSISKFKIANVLQAAFFHWTRQVVNVIHLNLASVKTLILQVYEFEFALLLRASLGAI